MVSSPTQRYLVIEEAGGATFSVTLLSRLLSAVSWPLLPSLALLGKTQLNPDCPNDFLCQIEFTFWEMTFSDVGVRVKVDLVMKILYCLISPENNLDNELSLG